MRRVGLRRVVVGALNVESQCSWAAVHGNEFEFRRPSLERAVQLDVCVHCSSCGTLRGVVHSPLIGSTIVAAGYLRRGVEWPDGAYDSVWDCVCR